MEKYAACSDDHATDDDVMIGNNKIYVCYLYFHCIYM